MLDSISQFSNSFQKWNCSKCKLRMDCRREMREVMLWFSLELAANFAQNIKALETYPIFTCPSHLPCSSPSSQFFACSIPQQSIPPSIPSFRFPSSLPNNTILLSPICPLPSIYLHTLPHPGLLSNRRLPALRLLPMSIPLIATTLLMLKGETSISA